MVVYGSRLSDTARVWWLLKYVGLDQVALLDGGWDGWTNSDRPIERAARQVAATAFKPEFQADLLAELDSVKQSLADKSVKVVDTRSDREFSGGRIPGAVQLEWTHLLAEDGRFKTATQLKELFRSRGILPTDTAVCY